jgi:RNA polymerase sigma-70 factor, ECF subfamily
MWTGERRWVQFGFPAPVKVSNFIRMRYFGGPQQDGGGSETRPDPSARELDESGMRELCREHTPALLRYVLSLCARDRYVAEDVVQETLLRAWLNSAALARRRGSVRPWLFTVARNIVVDRHRARQARPVEIGDETLVAGHAALDDLDAALTSWAVQDAMRTLSHPHRQVLVEIYLRGRSVAETAKLLGVPSGTVKSRTYYAMRALRIALEERGLAPQDHGTQSSPDTGERTGVTGGAGAPATA